MDADSRFVVGGEWRDPKPKRTKVGVSGLGFGLRALGVQGSGFRVHDSELRV